MIKPRQNISQFYIYAYLDPRKPGKFVYDKLIFNFEPFYIGKGKGKRAEKHLCKSNLIRDTNLYKRNKILKIQSMGYDLKKYIHYIFVDLEENESLVLETQIIKNIGKYKDNKGPLTNILDGGRGGPVMYGLNNPNTKPEVNTKKSKSLIKAYKEGRMKCSFLTMSIQKKREIGNKLSISKLKFWSNHENREKMIKNHFNNHKWVLIDPYGVRYKIEYGFNDFCKKHNIYPVIMRKIANGIYPKFNYKGWGCELG